MPLGLEGGGEVTGQGGSGPGEWKRRETGSPQEPPEREAALLMPRLWLSEPIAGILTSRTVR